MSGNEVSGRKSTLLSESQLCASDENFDCISCADDNKQKEACGFCVDCGEYLCRECVDFHKTFRFTKDHVIKDTEAMPRDAKQAQLIKSKDTCTELCKKHPGKILEYYCKPHDELGCSVCVTLGHITCRAGYIPELSDGVANSDDYVRLSTNISQLKESFYKTKETYKESIAEVENKSKTYTDEVTQFGEDIIKHVRDLVQKAIDEKDEVVKEMLVGLAGSQVESEKTMEEITTMHEDLKSKKDSDNQSFVLMKMFQMNVKKVEEALAEAQISSKLTVFQFVENPDIKCVEDIENLGKLFKYKKITKQYENINISTQKDTETPEIRSLEIMSDRRIAIVDNKNKSIKLVDTNDNTVSEINLQRKPWDITEVSKGQLAVTFPHLGDSKIQLLNVADKLTLGRVLDTDQWCRGITGYQDNLIVSFPSANPQVQVLDMNGKVLRSINTGENGEKLFLGPYHVAVNPNNNMIYVSDCDKGTVTFMTLEGEVKAIYNTDNPLGLCLGEADTVYVCNLDRVEQIAANGTKIQTLLDPDKDGDESWAVAYDTNTGKLYLGYMGPLRVYQLE